MNKINLCPYAVYSLVERSLKAVAGDFVWRLETLKSRFFLWEPHGSHSSSSIGLQLKSWGGTACARRFARVRWLIHAAQSLSFPLLLITAQFSTTLFIQCTVGRHQSWPRCGALFGSSAQLKHGSRIMVHVYMYLGILISGWGSGLMDRIHSILTR